MKLELTKDELVAIREASKEMAAAQAMYLKAEATVFTKVAKAIGYAKPADAFDAVRENLWKLERAGSALLFDNAKDWNIAFVEAAHVQLIEWAQEDIDAAQKKLNSK